MGRWRDRWAGLRSRFAWKRAYPADLLPDATAAVRGRVLAEAILALVVGFTLDDLRVLRFPGYLAGILAAVAILAFGGLVHGRELAARLAGRSPEDTTLALRRTRTIGRVGAIVVGVLFVLWLAAFSSGVPPWVG